MQLLEERQISRMILELVENRDRVATLAEENSKLWAVVERQDAEIARLTRIAELHKNAAGDRDRALKLKDEAEQLYKKSLADKDKRIARLEKENGALRKLLLVAFVVGAALGVAAQ